MLPAYKCLTYKYFDFDKPGILTLAERYLF